MPITEAGSRTASSLGCSWSRRAPRSVCERRRHGDLVERFGRRPAAVLEAQQAIVDHHRDELLDEERVAAGRLCRSWSALVVYLPPSNSSTSASDIASRERFRGRSDPRSRRLLEIRVDAGRARDAPGKRAGSGPPRDWLRCSIRSSSVGSAQWRSWMTTTRGLSAAMLSSSVRMPQNSFLDRELGVRRARLRRRPATATSLSPPASATKLLARRLGRILVADLCCLADDLDQRPKGNASPVGEAAALDDSPPRSAARRTPHQTRLSHPGSPSTLTTLHARSSDARIKHCSRRSSSASRPTSGGLLLRRASRRRSAIRAGKPRRAPPCPSARAARSPRPRPRRARVGRSRGRSGCRSGCRLFEAGRDVDRVTRPGARPGSGLRRRSRPCLPRSGW